MIPVVCAGERRSVRVGVTLGERDVRGCARGEREGGVRGAELVWPHSFRS
jgi:hypothetical protein